jgi:hypothetical protein
VSVFVVNQGWAYEGEVTLWAGVDFEQAMTFADSVEYSDTVTVYRLDPDPREAWVREGRRTDELTMIYEYRVSNGSAYASTWKTIDTLTRSL